VSPDGATQLGVVVESVDEVIDVISLPGGVDGCDVVLATF
jgi:hypothetical protein